MKLFLVLFFFLPSGAVAYDSQRAQANLASDYATCAAYYMVSTEIFRNNSKDASKFEAAAKNALDMAVRLSNRKVTSARVDSRPCKIHLTPPSATPNERPIAG